ncbi:hypothetical protein ACFE04_002720 [Oxalis oulophora]
MDFSLFGCSDPSTSSSADDSHSLMLLWVHSSGCIFYLLADVYIHPGLTWIGQLHGADFKAISIRRRYGVSLYWSMTTFTTVGYGDFHPSTEVESWYVSIVMFVNMGFSCYAMGELGNIFITTCLSKSIRTASSLLRRLGISREHRNEIIDHLTLKLKRDDEDKCMKCFSKTTKAKINCELYLAQVQQGYMFKGVSTEFLVQLVYEMKIKDFSIGEDIILQHASPNGFYIVIKGVVEMVEKRNHRYEIIGEAISCICGEIGVVFDVPSVLGYRARSNCTLLFVKNKSFENVLYYHVKDKALIMANVLQYLKTSTVKTMIEAYSNIKFLIFKGVKEIELPIHVGTLMNDDHWLAEMIDWQNGDVDEIDNEGKTAMHIASKNGNMKCVKALAQKGANVNINDINGHVPIWEAILENHEDVVSYFRDIPADINKGDVGAFACKAAELKDIRLLSAIKDCGGDLFCPRRSDGAIVEVERMRGRTHDKLMNKLAAARHKAEEKRASTEAKRNHQASITEQQADYIR